MSEPESDAVEIHHYTAVGFEPGKVYLLEYDRHQIDQHAAQSVLQWLTKQGIIVLIVGSQNGKGLRVIDPQTGGGLVS